MEDVFRGGAFAEPVFDFRDGGIGIGGGQLVGDVVSGVGASSCSWPGRGIRATGSSRRSWSPSGESSLTIGGRSDDGVSVDGGAMDAFDVDADEMLLDQLLQDVGLHGLLEIRRRRTPRLTPRLVRVVEAERTEQSESGQPLSPSVLGGRHSPAATAIASDADTEEVNDVLLDGTLYAYEVLEGAASDDIVVASVSGADEADLLPSVLQRPQAAGGGSGLWPALSLSGQPASATVPSLSLTSLVRRIPAVAGHVGRPFEWEPESVDSYSSRSNAQVRSDEDGARSSLLSFGGLAIPASSRRSDSPEFSARTVLSAMTEDNGLSSMISRLSGEGFHLDESLVRSLRRVLQLSSVLVGQRLSEEEVRMLPKVRFEEEELQQCPICLESYRRGELLNRLHCGHFFHVDCLGRWMQRATQCPLCRTQCGE